LFRLLLAAAVLFTMGAPALSGQSKKNVPYADLPILQPKDNKKDAMRDESLPALKAPPGAVVAATSHLTFETLPLSGKGLLSAQVRESLRTLLRNAGSSTVVKLRAFVAGSGDVRRVQEIAAEVFGERHLALPVLTVVQVGALPLESAQVSLEATLESKRELNPNGLAFVAAQSGDSPASALKGITAVLERSGLSAADAVRATCFVSMLDSGAGVPALGEAKIVVVQMQREPVRPAATCEAVARLRAPVAEGVRVVSNEQGTPDAALVSAPRLAISGVQLGFGKQDSDIALALERIDRALAEQGSAWKQVVYSHAYVMSRSTANPLSGMLRERIGEPRPFTILPFEGLSSIDAMLGIDVIAVAGQ
jgi:enamine deaminase RidA (YjgF/YER057c/UK114 family)